MHRARGGAGRRPAEQLAALLPGPHQRRVLAELAPVEREGRLRQARDAHAHVGPAEYGPCAGAQRRDRGEVDKLDGDGVS
jgi:hypothetical protein